MSLKSATQPEPSSSGSSAGELSALSLVYVTHMTYPSVAAHAIQISRTVSALARLAKVYLIVKRMGGSVADAEKMYDLRLGGGLKIVTCRSRFGLLGMAWLVWKSCRRAPGPGVFYTRSYGFAKDLIRLRPLHGRQVFFESHKKMGFYKEDFVSGSEFNKERGTQEADNEPIELIKKVYMESDCVFFLHDHSRKIAAEDLGLRRTVWNWYGIDVEKPLPNREAKYDFIYCGSVSKGKLVSLLLDAAAKMEGTFTFHIFGRCTDETRRWLEAEIVTRGLGACLSYEGILPFSELQQRLADYRFGVATMEGIKVIDYIENGLTLVIPRNASYEEVFGDDDVCYYEADNASDLARAMSACTDSRGRRQRVSEEIRQQFSLKNRAERIVKEMNPVIL